MSSQESASRRDFLRLSLTVVGAVAAGPALVQITGCSNNSANPVTPPQETELRLDTTTPAYAALATPVHFLAVDSPGGTRLNVFRVTTTEATALSRICTHMQCDLGPGNGSLVGTQLVCGCHGSRYNIETGAVIAGPAPANLRSYPTRIEGSIIIISLA